MNEKKGKAQRQGNGLWHTVIALRETCAPMIWCSPRLEKTLMASRLRAVLMGAMFLR